MNIYMFRDIICRVRSEDEESACLWSDNFHKYKYLYEIPEKAHNKDILENLKDDYVPFMCF